MNLGIIGAGSLGTALGERLAEQGHTIMFGGAASAQDAAVRQRARVGSNAETAAFGDVVILAVPFAAIEAALAEAAPLRGRVLWSCVNALKPDYTGLVVGFDNSAAERSRAGRRGCSSSPRCLPSLTRSRPGSSATTTISRQPSSCAEMMPRRSGPSRPSCVTSAPTPSMRGRSRPRGWSSRR